MAAVGFLFPSITVADIKALAVNAPEDFCSAYMRLFQSIFKNKHLRFDSLNQITGFDEKH